MPHITSREAVAIAQIAIYGIVFILALILFSSDGWGRNLPWLFLILFSALRITGGALAVAAIGNPDPLQLLVGAAICSSIGLSLLLLIPLEMLRRVNARCFKYYPAWLETTFAGLVLIIHLLVLVAVILGIVGGVRAQQSLMTTGSFRVGILLEISSILFVVAFVIFIGVLVFAVVNNSRKISRNRYLLAAVVLSTPLLLVRLVYNILGFIVKDNRFNPFFGQLGFFIGLSFIMEILATGVFVIGGFMNFGRHKKRRRSRSSRSRSRSRTATASSHSDEVEEVVVVGG